MTHKQLLKIIKEYNGDTCAEAVLIQSLCVQLLSAFDNIADLKQQLRELSE